MEKSGYRATVGVSLHAYASSQHDADFVSKGSKADIIVQREMLENI
jgi:hypothetical protein